MPRQAKRVRQHEDGGVGGDHEERGVDRPGRRDRLARVRTATGRGLGARRRRPLVDAGGDARWQMRGILICRVFAFLEEAGLDHPFLSRTRCNPQLLQERQPSAMLNAGLRLNELAAEFDPAPLLCLAQRLRFLLRRLERALAVLVLDVGLGDVARGLCEIECRLDDRGDGPHLVTSLPTCARRWRAITPSMSTVVFRAPARAVMQRSLVPDRNDSITASCWVVRFTV